MAYRYTYQGYDGSKMARAVGLSLPISPKQAIEICSHLKHRSVESAKLILERAIAKEQAIPFKRYKHSISHKPGIATGRYPKKASEEIMELIESAEANAHNKGLNELYITHMNAHKAASRRRAGRVVGESKIAHVEIVVEEMKKESGQKSNKSQSNPNENKEKPKKAEK